MKLWLAKNPEVPIHDQLLTQIKLAIAANDLQPGDKLPGTRSIARRYGIHHNTIGAAYKRLVDDGVLEFRRGSGYFVTGGGNETCAANEDASLSLERRITELLSFARQLGYREEEVARRIENRLASISGTRILLFESDAALREILLYELTEAGLNADSHDIASFKGNRSIKAAQADKGEGVEMAAPIITALVDEKHKIEPMLESGVRRVFLTGQSVSLAMMGEERPGEGTKIAVASGWQGFLGMAKVMLLAAGIASGDLIIRSTRSAGWMRTVCLASFVICDALTATLLTGKVPTRVFNILSEESLAKLQREAGLIDH